MQAVVSGVGGPEVLTLQDMPKPHARASEILVRVHATALNRADLMQRAGSYPAPPGAPSDILGIEYAGVVEALGEGATRFAVGDRVFGLVGGGAYAEYIRVHEATAVRMPSNFSFEQAAAFPEAYLTAYDAIVSQAGLAAGETVLIHAVGSGVGTAAVQIAKAIGAKSIGTARTLSKLAPAKALGLDVGIEVNTDEKNPEPQFAKQVAECTESKGADVILDLVGAGYFAENLRAAAKCGRIIVVGLVAGRKAEIDLGLLLGKRLRVQGTVMRSRELGERIQVAGVLARHLVPLAEAGALRSIIAENLPLAEAVRAHKLLESNASFGKIVLTVA